MEAMEVQNKQLRDLEITPHQQLLEELQTHTRKTIVKIQQQYQKDMDAKEEQIQQQQRDTEAKDDQIQQQQRDMEVKEGQIQHLVEKLENRKRKRNSSFNEVTNPIAIFPKELFS